MYEGKFPKKRYKHTLQLLNEVISKGANNEDEDLFITENKIGPIKY